MHELNDHEWELLCDGCAKCCLEKLQDINTGEIKYTSVPCEYLDLNSCKCKDYKLRTKIKTGCVELKSDKFKFLKFLPSTCSYKLIYQGKSLPSWHHLISGDRQTVHKTFNSIKNFELNERKKKIKYRYRSKFLKKVMEKS